MVTIAESGLIFGPFPDEDCFQIERSEIYQKVQDGVQIAEFLYLRTIGERQPQVWIVEAKSSSPRPATKPNFQDFMEEIRDKLSNALSLAVACCLKRHEASEQEMPYKFRVLDLANAKFRLVLVVKGHEDAWLPPLQDALIKLLHPTIKTWALGANSVAVLNEIGARRFGLIQ